MGPEETFQSKTIIPYLDILVKQERLRYTHVPNGGMRKIGVARQMKELGQMRGFPDLIIMAPKFVGFIEVKRPVERVNGKITARGYLRKDQKAWRDYFQANGIPWALVESLDDLVNILREWKLI